MNDVTTVLDKPTTRRTIVKTGVKLAYAAPLVAGSFQLARVNAGAQTTSEGGVQDPICLGTKDGCTGGGCGPGGVCICTTTPEGGVFCFSQGCGAPCDSSDDCGGAGLCSVNTGGCCTPGDCILYENFCTPEVAPFGADSVVRQ